MLRLYTSALSANGRKTWAVAKHLGIRLSIENINVYKGEGNNPEYRAINPWGKIPTLVDGDFVLWESNAIIVYLSECYGDNVLYSDNRVDRANILKLLFWESSQWQPALNRVLAPRVGHLLFARGDRDVPTTDWHDSDARGILNDLKIIIGSKPFLCGNTVTLADYSIAAMTTYFSLCNFPYATYPEIYAWMERMDSLPSWFATKEAFWSA